MRIIDWLKRIINSLRKVKMLNFPMIEFADENIGMSNFKIQVFNNELDKINMYELYELGKTQDVQKKDKVLKILELLNCSDENLLKNINSDDLDINNFRENLKILTSFPVSKLEIAILISSNPNILYLNNSIIKNSIFALKRWINDDFIVKNIIFNNPFVLNEDIEKNLENTYSILEKYNITNKLIKYILDENPNIINMDKKRLENSLKSIMNMFNSNQDYIDEIIGNSNIIGVVDLNFLEKYISKKV